MSADETKSTYVCFLEDQERGYLKKIRNLNTLIERFLKFAEEYVEYDLPQDEVVETLKGFIYEFEESKN